MLLGYLESIDRFLWQMLILPGIGTVILLILLAIFTPIYFLKLKNNRRDIIVSWLISIGLALSGSVLTFVGSINHGILSWLVILGPFVIFSGIILGIFAIIKIIKAGNQRYNDIKYDNGVTEKKFIFFTFILAILSVAILSGCFMGPVLDECYSKQDYKDITESLPISVEPDSELFSKYFSSIQIDETEDAYRKKYSNRTFLSLVNNNMILFGFNVKKEFKFIVAVYDKDRKKYIKRLSSEVSSSGSDGGGMEILEHAFLYPGDYELRIFVEEKLVKVLPFKIIPMWEYYIP